MAMKKKTATVYNKKMLVESISERTGLTKADTKRTLDAMLEIIPAIIGEGNTIRLVGFGTFEKRHRSARPGKNPQTGEPITIDAKNILAFKSHISY